MKLKNNHKCQPFVRLCCWLLVSVGVLAPLGCSQYKVYSVKDDPTFSVSGGVLYALPKTQLRVDVTVEHRDFSQAPYRDYAVDFLGVGEETVDSNYHLTTIDVDGVNTADPDHYYYVKVRRGSVTIDRRHLLLAIGMDNPDKNQLDRPSPTVADTLMSQPPTHAVNNLYDRFDTLYSRYDMPGRPSLVSSKKDVRTIRQRAAAAAERLQEIQEKQQQLINGEYEGTYSAEAVQYLYAQLRIQESQIVEMFCGKVRRETVSFYVEPTIRRKEAFVDTIIWFSPTAGFIGDSSLCPEDCFPIVCSVNSDNSLRSAGRFVKYHTSGISSDYGAGHTGRSAVKNNRRKNFRYRVPEKTLVVVSSPLFSVKRVVPFSQLGPIVELPRYRIRALFDAKTLDLMELKINN
ncbi:MAG: DUF4831 family protein [Bacteroidales bacterium]|nr:DUF4831 family protein [Bacteroidales bacterium]